MNKGYIILRMCTELQDAFAFCIKEHLNKMYEHPCSGKQNTGFINIAGIHFGALSSCSCLCSLNIFGSKDYTSEKDLVALQKFPSFFKNPGKSKMSPWGPQSPYSVSPFLYYAENLSTCGRSSKPALSKYALQQLSQELQSRPCIPWGICPKSCKKPSVEPRTKAGTHESPCFFLSSNP